jgi:hypothetical protein
MSRYDNCNYGTQPAIEIFERYTSTLRPDWTDYAEKREGNPNELTKYREYREGARKAPPRCAEMPSSDDRLKQAVRVEED